MGVQETEKLKQICSVIHQTVETEKIYLFGSYAYGVPTQNSDFDLCVIIPDNDLRPADAIKKIRRALYPVQDMPLDIIVYRSEDFTNRQQTASLERKISRGRSTAVCIRNGWNLRQWTWSRRNSCLECGRFRWKSSVIIANRRQKSS